MSHEVTLPVLGESVSSGTVSRWLKKVGDTVAQDEPLVEISTDKVDTEVPSPVSGILAEIRVHEDETANVGAVLAIIEDRSDDILAHQSSQFTPPAHVPSFERPATSFTPPAPEERPALTLPPAEPGPTGLHIPSSPYVPPSVAPAAIAEDLGNSQYVTPLVRKLALEHGVDLATVQGSGVGGRIRKQDILDAAASPRPAFAPQSASLPSLEPLAEVIETPAPVPAEPEPEPPAEAPAESLVAEPPVVESPVVESPAEAPAAAGVLAQPVEPVVAPAPQAAVAEIVVVEAQPSELVGPPEPVSPLVGTTEKMSRLRSTIAHRMVESLQASAQLTATVEVDLTVISHLRNRVKADFKAREGAPLTYLAFIAKATAEALKAHPKLNATIDLEAETVTYQDGENLGIAVDTPKGLFVPVIRDAGDLSVSGLAKKIADLGARTRANQITPDELAGGTFTITNYGSTGTLFDTPIINQPQVAILGVGASVRRPVVVNDPRLGEIMTIRDMMYLSLTYDHRLVDGADASRFLATVKTRLEAGDFKAEF